MYATAPTSVSSLKLPSHPLILFDIRPQPIPRLTPVPLPLKPFSELRSQRLWGPREGRIYYRIFNVTLGVLFLKSNKCRGTNF